MYHRFCYPPVTRRGLGDNLGYIDNGLIYWANLNFTFSNSLVKIPLDKVLKKQVFVLKYHQKIGSFVLDYVYMLDTIQTYQESLYLLLSNRQKCQELLNKETLEENDIIDIYISLHLVLEVGLNGLHRQIITSQIVKPIDKHEVIRNIDGIGFIEKTILFIYNAHFDFRSDLNESAIHHKIIGKLKGFAGIRNKLLHGHSIGSLTDDENVTSISDARSNLDIDKLKTQIKLFIDINNGMKFFLDHLDNDGWSDGYIEDLKNEYLNYSFIPANFINNEILER